MYFFGKSDIGRKRATNQDNFQTVRFFDNCCLCVICDGMGGANGGNIASEIAVKFFTDGVRKRLMKLPVKDETLAIDPIASRDEIGTLLQGAADYANGAVFRRAGEDARLAGMGTTLIAALIIDNYLFVLNIGDSRLYQITPRSIRQLTRDHSYLQYLIDSGQIRPEEAENTTIRNIITRSLGTEEHVKGDVYLMRLEGEGFLLLCSDGLSGYVDNEVIAETVNAPCVIQENTDNDYELEDKAERLIEIANEAGGGDNITVILLKYAANNEAEVET